MLKRHPSVFRDKPVVMRPDLVVMRRGCSVLKHRPGVPRRAHTGLEHHAAAMRNAPAGIKNGPPGVRTALRSHYFVQRVTFFTPADVVETNALWAPYDAAYGALPPAENAYNAALSTLNEDEENFIDHVRSLVAEIQSNPDVTDAQRTAAGLPIRKTTRTAASVPTTRPVAEVDTSQRLQHTISFRNEGATDRARPEGVRGCEVWCHIGPTPANVCE